MLLLSLFMGHRQARPLSIPLSIQILEGSLADFEFCLKSAVGLASNPWPLRRSVFLRNFDRAGHLLSSMSGGSSNFSPYLLTVIAVIAVTQLIKGVSATSAAFAGSCTPLATANDRPGKYKYSFVTQFFLINTFSKSKDKRLSFSQSCSCFKFYLKKIFVCMIFTILYCSGFMMKIIEGGCCCTQRHGLGSGKLDLDAFAVIRGPVRRRTTGERERCCNG